MKVCTRSGSTMRLLFSRKGGIGLPGLGALALSLLLAICVCFQPRADAQARNQNSLVLILCDGLRLEDLQSDSLQALRDVASRGSLGLMNCAVNGKRSGVSAMLAIAAGTQLPAEDTDSQAYNDWEIPQGENGSARMAYMRRMGPLNSEAQKQLPDPEQAVKHLGVASLEKRRISRNTLGAALASAGITRWIGGCADTDKAQRAASLLTVDAQGLGAGAFGLLRHDNSAAYGKIDDPLALIQATEEALETHRFCVVQVGDLSRLEAARSYLSDSQFHIRRSDALRRLNILVFGLSQLASTRADLDVLFVSPHPPADVQYGRAWNRLTPIAGIGPHFSAGLMTSDTTRRSGLVANTDIAPTILQIFSVEDRPTTFTGRPIRTEAAGGSTGDSRLAYEARLDFVSHMNEPAKTVLLYPMGVFYFLVVAAALLLCRKAPGQAHWLTPFLVSGLNIPAAMLLAPVLMPPTMLEYGLRILAWAAGLTLVAYGIGMWRKLSPSLVTMLLTMAILAADTLTGQHLQKDSLFCTYTIAGMRFYGTGNEYLGIILPFSILAVFQLLDEKPGFVRAALPTAVALWIAVAFLCGWPSLGANAGSLIVTTVAFGAGILKLRKMPINGLALCFLTAAGLGLAFVFGAADASINGVHSSHSGAALRAAGNGRGAEYLAEIAMRKAQLNLGYLLTPAVLLGIVAVVLSAWIANAAAGERLRSALARRPWSVAGFAAIGAGCIAALMFKDSGVVTIDFTLGAMVVLIVDAMVTDGASAPIRRAGTD